MSSEKGNGKDFRDLENIADVIGKLALEDFLFAGEGGTGWDNTGISLTPGQTVLNFTVKGSEGDDVTFSALPLMLIRRDEGECRLGIRMHILSPEALRGRIAETWYMGDTPAAPASFHIIEEGDE